MNHAMADAFPDPLFHLPPSWPLHRPAIVRRGHACALRRAREQVRHSNPARALAHRTEPARRISRDRPRCGAIPMTSTAGRPSFLAARSRTSAPISCRSELILPLYLGRSSGLEPTPFPRRHNTVQTPDPHRPQSQSARPIQAQRWLNSSQLNSRLMK